MWWHACPLLFSVFPNDFHPFDAMYMKWWNCMPWLRGIRQEFSHGENVFSSYLFWRAVLSPVSTILFFHEYMWMWLMRYDAWAWAWWQKAWQYDDYLSYMCLSTEHTTIMEKDHHLDASRKVAWMRIVFQVPTDSCWSSRNVSGLSLMELSTKSACRIPYIRCLYHMNIQSAKMNLDTTNFNWHQFDLIMRYGSGIFIHFGFGNLHK